MNDLISRAALLEKIRERLSRTNEGSICRAILADAEELALSAPAVEAAPVVHERWIEENGIQICSNCGEEHEWEEYRASYCEVCGARMDGESNG